MLMIGTNVPKDALVWYRNPDPNAETDTNNINRPLYLVIYFILKLIIVQCCQT